MGHVPEESFIRDPVILLEKVDSFLDHPLQPGGWHLTMRDAEGRFIVMIRKDLRK